MQLIDHDHNVWYLITIALQAFNNITISVTVSCFIQYALEKQACLKLGGGGFLHCHLMRALLVVVTQASASIHTSRVAKVIG